MFWKRKGGSVDGTAKPAVTFAEAADATRRAAFLNVAQGMTADETYRRQLSELFQACRSAALTAGADAGRSPTEVDAIIGDLCDADTARLSNSSDDEFRAFAKESGEIVSRFLSAL